MKNYKKILEGVVNIINTTEKSDIGFANICIYIGENCPELKESEDEKIRKELIEFVKGWKEKAKGFCPEAPLWTSDKEDCDRYITWLENIPYTIDHEKREGFHLGYKVALEKQGETFTKKDVDDAYLEGMAFAKDELEKQNKQILANSTKTCKDEQEPTDEEMKTLLRTEYEKGRADAIAEMQKPVDCTDCTNSKGCINCEDGNMKETLVQNPAWSEEDETIADNLALAIANDKIRPQDRDDYCDWLKSLKDRYTWKPSDEQLEALADALSLAKSCGEESAFDLRTLYEQLKKL